MVPKKSIRKLLNQLRVKELIELARKRSITIPSNWKKPQIVELLELSVSERELLKIFPKAKTPAKGYIKGHEFEQKVKKWFKNKGYKCTTRNQKKTKDGIISEIDIIGHKTIRKFLSSEKKWIFVECKNIDKVPPTEWHKFLGKYETFRKQHKDEKVVGWLCATGIFHPNVKKEKVHHRNIKLKRFPIK